MLPNVIVAVCLAVWTVIVDFSPSNGANSVVSSFEDFWQSITSILKISAIPSTPAVNPSLTTFCPYTQSVRYPWCEVIGDCPDLSDVADGPVAAIQSQCYDTSTSSTFDCCYLARSAERMPRPMDHVLELVAESCPLFVKAGPVLLCLTILFLLYYYYYFKHHQKEVISPNPPPIVSATSENHDLFTKHFFKVLRGARHAVTRVAELPSTIRHSLLAENARLKLRLMRSDLREQDLQRDLAQNNLMLGGLLHRNEMLEKDKSSLGAENMGIHATLDNMVSQLQATAERFNEQTMEVTELKVRVKAAEEEASTARRFWLDAQMSQPKEFRDAKDKASRLEHELRLVKNNLDLEREGSRTSDKTIIKLHQEVKSLKETNAQVAENSKKNESTVESFKQKLAAANGRLNSVTNELSTTKANVESAKKDAEAQKEEKEATRKEYEEALSQHQATAVDLSNVQRALDKAEADLEATKSNLQVALTENETFTEELNLSQTNRSKIEAELKASKSQLQTALAQQETTAQDLQISESKLSQLRSELHEKEFIISTSKWEKSMMEAQQPMMEKQAETANITKQSSQSTNTATNSEVETFQTQKDELKSEHLQTLVDLETKLKARAKAWEDLFRKTHNFNLLWYTALSQEQFNEIEKDLLLPVDEREDKTKWGTKKPSFKELDDFCAGLENQRMPYAGYKELIDEIKFEQLPAEKQNQILKKREAKREREMRERELQIQKDMEQRRAAYEAEQAKLPPPPANRKIAPVYSRSSQTRAVASSSNSGHLFDFVPIHKFASGADQTLVLPETSTAANASDPPPNPFSPSPSEGMVAEGGADQPQGQPLTSDTGASRGETDICSQLPSANTSETADEAVKIPWAASPVSALSTSDEQIRDTSSPLAESIDRPVVEANGLPSISPAVPTVDTSDEQNPETSSSLVANYNYSAAESDPPSSSLLSNQTVQALVPNPPASTHNSETDMDRSSVFYRSDSAYSEIVESLEDDVSSFMSKFTGAELESGNDELWKESVGNQLGSQQSESIPTQPIPAQSIPTQSIPTQSTPTQSTPTQSTPTQSTPPQSTPTDSTPAQSIPAITVTPPVASDTATSASQSEDDQTLQYALNNLDKLMECLNDLKVRDRDTTDVEMKSELETAPTPVGYTYPSDFDLSGEHKEALQQLVHNIYQSARLMSDMQILTPVEELDQIRHNGVERASTWFWTPDHEIFKTLPLPDEYFTASWTTWDAYMRASGRWESTDCEVVMTDDSNQISNNFPTHQQEHVAQQPDFDNASGASSASELKPSQPSMDVDTEMSHEELPEAEATIKLFSTLSIVDNAEKRQADIWGASVKSTGDTPKKHTGTDDIVMANAKEWVDFDGMSDDESHDDSDIDDIHRCGIDDQMRKAKSEAESDDDNDRGSYRYSSNRSEADSEAESEAESDDASNRGSYRYPKPSRLRENESHNRRYDNSQWYLKSRDREPYYEENYLYPCVLPTSPQQAALQPPQERRTQPRPDRGASVQYQYPNFISPDGQVPQKLEKYAWDVADDYRAGDGPGAELGLIRNGHISRDDSLYWSTAVCEQGGIELPPNFFTHNWEGWDANLIKNAENKILSEQSTSKKIPNKRGKARPPTQASNTPTSTPDLLTSQSPACLSFLGLLSSVSTLPAPADPSEYSPTPPPGPVRTASARPPQSSSPLRPPPSSARRGVRPSAVLNRSAELYAECEAALSESNSSSPHQPGNRTPSWPGPYSNLPRNPVIRTFQPPESIGLPNPKYRLRPGPVPSSASRSQSANKPGSIVKAQDNPAPQSAPSTPADQADSIEPSPRPIPSLDRHTVDDEPNVGIRQNLQDYPIYQPAVSIPANSADSTEPAPRPIPSLDRHTVDNEPSVGGRPNLEAWENEGAPRRELLNGIPTSAEANSNDMNTTQDADDIPLLEQWYLRRNDRPSSDHEQPSSDRSHSSPDDQQPPSEKLQSRSDDAQSSSDSQPPSSGNLQSSSEDLSPSDGRDTSSLQTLQQSAPVQKEDSLKNEHSDLDQFDPRPTKKLDTDGLPKEDEVTGEPLLEQWAQGQPANSATQTPANNQGADDDDSVHDASARSLLAAIDGFLKDAALRRRG